MAWIVLIVSGLLETAWAISLSASKGFTRLWPTVSFGVTLVASMGGLAYALRTIPVGTGYAVWVAIGAVGTALVGMFFLGEGFSLPKALCLLLIVSGVIGLKLLH
ncbi:multidrug efflux SMR transporter [Nocardiopsis sp. NPDC006139]|uniref:DMT family transporter n=1 Tax=unclassified Nocardiopsis TaxID=2649073 RepID=UPI00159AA7B1|nr:multidrug efflux SMR transporter [Nocardiopsis flavescens]